MKTRDADIIMIPGYGNSGEDHWQTRWENKLSTATRVAQEDWLKPVVEEWTQNLISAMDQTTKPIVLVAHSLGVHVVAQSVKQLNQSQKDKISAAFLVAPPDVEREKIKPKHLRTFGPYPRDPFPFPSTVIASLNDPFCSIEVADQMAACWGSLFIDAGEQGHINPASGHGPWPEGLMVFSKFMSRLKA